MDETLDDSPSLRRYPAEILGSQYEVARLKAAGETGLDVGAFPVACPFTIEQVLDPVSGRTRRSRDPRHQGLPAGQWSHVATDTVVLDFDQRHRRRFAMPGEGGTSSCSTSPRRSRSATATAWCSRTAASSR